MDYSDLLHDFIDGSLGAADAEQLFYAIAASPALRRELQELITIKAGLQNDAVSLVPPPALTQSVFSQLGFSVTETPPVSAVNGYTKANTAPAVFRTSAGHSGFWNFLKHYRQTLIAVPLSVLITIFLLWWNKSVGFFSQSKGSAIAANVQNGSGGRQIPPGYETGWSGYPRDVVATNADTVRERVIIREVVREVVKYLPAPNDGKTSESIELPKNLISSAEPLYLAPRLPLKNAPAINPVFVNRQAEAPGLLQPEEGIATFPFRIEARGIVAQSFPKPTIGSGDIPILNNTLFNVMVNVAGRHWVGLEAGQEAYFQQFYYEKPEGLYLVSQNPVLPWVGLAYRYELPAISVFTPFLHLVAGATKNGPLGRVLAGFSFMPDSRTQFMLGFEASSLLYTQQNFWYNSSKLGVSYGVSVRF